MLGHGAKFGRKMEQAIAALLSHQSVEAAARAIGVSANTLLRWTKEPEFEAAYREARHRAYQQSIGRLPEAAGAAVSTVLRIMLDPNAPASTRLRAAEVVLERADQAIDLEDFEARGEHPPTLPVSSPKALLGPGTTPAETSAPGPDNAGPESNEDE